jgi:pimeloyl-ACP methyl ester carboxylesterase
MSSTLQMRTGRLSVPGASLYYEVRGAGPVLLMMPGGPADSGTFRNLAGYVGPKYTVVTYDPRGLSHSTLEEPLDEERIVQVFADDVYRLLAAVADGKADVFASSGGATIALELAARHPEQLKTMVAHEPPSPALQPNSTQTRADMDDVHETFLKAGIGPAMQKFMVMTRIQGGPPPAQQGEPTPEMLEAAAQFERNMQVFLGPYFVGLSHYDPDFAALKAASCRIVPGVGDESRGQMAHDGGLALARLLGTDAVVFPGAHGGYDSHAAEFAPRLREVLEA